MRKFGTPLKRGEVYTIKPGKFLESTVERPNSKTGPRKGTTDGIETPEFLNIRMAPSEIKKKKLF